MSPISPLAARSMTDRQTRRGPGNDTRASSTHLIADTSVIVPDHNEGVRQVEILRHLDDVAEARREVLEHELVELRQVLEHRGAA